MKTTIHFTQAWLQALLIHAPKNDVRYYLNGVHVFNDGTRCIAEATDGRRMLRIDLLGENDNRDANANGSLGIFDVVIPRDMIAAMAKVHHPYIEIDGTNLVAPVAKVIGTAINGQFPQGDRVLSMTRGPDAARHRGDFNVRYMLDARKAVNLLNDRATTGRGVDESPVPWVASAADIDRGLPDARARAVSVGQNPDAHPFTDAELAAIRHDAALRCHGQFHGDGWAMAMMPLGAG